MPAGYSTEATSGATSQGGVSSTGDSTFGDFNFKGTQGSAAGIVSVAPWLIVAGAVGIGLVAWFVLRKQSRG